MAAPQGSQYLDLSSHYDQVVQKSLIQEILDTLFEDVLIHREKHSKRFFWELLQNAADTAEGEPVRVEFELNKTCVIFRHNGSPFSEEDMAHLRLYGTTKREKEKKVGRFGKGFISTHSIARKVIVRGQCKNRPEFFEFLIDREGTKEEVELKIKELFENRYIMLQPHPNVKEGFTTEYEYIYSSEEESANIPLEEFKNLIPWVLLFEKRIKSVTLKKDGVELFWTRRDDEQSILAIEYYFGESIQKFYFFMAEREGIQIAVPLKKIETETNEVYEILDMKKIPKLFISFPLVGTEEFPFPVPINCLSFVPLEQRDGIHLDKGNGINLHNKQLLEKAKELYFQLLDESERRDWKSPHLLVLLPDFQVAKDIVDVEWLKNFCKDIIHYCCTKKVVTTVEGDKCKPEEVAIPYCDNEETTQKIWSLAKPFGEIKFSDGRLLKLPDDISFLEWKKILEKWERYEPDQNILPRKLTIEELTKFVEGLGSISNLRKKAPELRKSRLWDWFKVFLLLAKEFKSLRVIPTQKGNFKSGPKRDPGIPESLKNIAQKLGWDLRSELINLQVSSLFEEREHFLEDDVVSELVRLAKEQANNREPTENFLTAILDFLSWLLKNKKYFEKLDNFPVINRKFDKGERTEILSFLKKTGKSY
jgi:hypothetical protein